VAASSRSLVFSDLPSAVFASDDFTDAFAQIANRRRRVPVPRRTLRLLARASRPVLVATVLGHLFRCVYSKGVLVASEGSVASSWVAAVFDVDQRNVKCARSTLAAMDWLAFVDCDHWHRQRYGQRVNVNLTWQDRQCSKMGLDVRQSPPQGLPNSTKIPPPKENRKLLKGLKNQKPKVSAERAGVQIRKHGLPDLGNVQREDLQDAARLMLLYDQARDRGIVGGSEHERLQFATAAVRASRRATSNTGGFFIRLVRDRLFHHATAVEESLAQRMLKRHLFESVATPEARDTATRTKIVNPPHSDVRLVARLSRAATEGGYTGDPFELLQRHSPDWSRHRWDSAMRAWLTPSQASSG
jgi:hypothetical protein